MKTYTVVIADDEDLNRERIKDLLADHPEFVVLGAAINGEEAIKMIHTHQPDILFLDIKMPLASGFEALDQVSAADYSYLVFVTAYDNYAIKAFEKEAFDYLLKPFSKIRFNKVIERIKRNLSQANSIVQPYLLVKTKQEIIKIDCQDILYLESADNYVLIHTASQTLKKRSTLVNLMKQLDDTLFMRIHRSFIVNVNHLKKMRHIYHGDYLIKLSNGKSLPTSRTYRSNVDRILNK